MSIPANHEPQYLHRDTQDMSDSKVNCLRCGQTSGWLESIQDCEDWWFQHEKEIERLKARLGSRTPTLLNQARYYRSMAESSTGPERAQWEALAVELEHRVNTQSQWQDVPLPGMP